MAVGEWAMGEEEEEEEEKISHCIIKTKVMSFSYPRLIIILKVLRMSLLSTQAQLQLPLSCSTMRSNTSERPPAREEEEKEQRNKRLNCRSFLSLWNVLSSCPLLSLPFTLSSSYPLLTPLSLSLQ